MAQRVELLLERQPVAHAPARRASSERPQPAEKVKAKLVERLLRFHPMD